MESGERTKSHERKESSQPIHAQEYEIDAYDAAVTFGDLEVGRYQSAGEEDGGDDADEGHGPFHAALVGTLGVGG